jgi:hypothetical protein
VLVLVSTVILGSESNGTHGHKLLSGGAGSVPDISSLSYSRIAQYFMEDESALPFSQESSIGPYPEPDEYSPYQPILFLQDL